MACQWGESDSRYHGFAEVETQQERGGLHTLFKAAVVKLADLAAAVAG